MSENNEKLTDHDYDGIREFDNPLPLWWLLTFFGTIIFAFLYWTHFELSKAGQTQSAELAQDLAALPQAPSGGADDSEETLMAFAANHENIEEGKEIFHSRCATCHGEHLQGGIGPNLVDDYWIHGQGKLADISKVVRLGVLDKGMPPWETMMKPDEIKSVVVFVASQKGANVQNPKAPQGVKVGSQ
jgi:cytochrome c oxidase cbb3-type subunit III